MTASSIAIIITGRVQGVGFRPFIYRLARLYGIFGWVENRNDGVYIRAEGSTGAIELFRKDIVSRAPTISRIANIETTPCLAENFTDFEIRLSQSKSQTITEVSPDLAVCEDCLQDMQNQPNRLDYPFVNCTNCGPRFSIIEDLPYDRKQTTMRDFTMCKSCQAEYDNPESRRFHAQPNACGECGPELTLTLSPSASPPSPLSRVPERRGTQQFPSPFGTPNGEGLGVRQASKILDSGGLLAIKGLGGFHLACDAANEEAVQRLRLAKNREGKPFAIMVKDIEMARQFALISSEEEALLLSNKRPVVLLRVETQNLESPPITNHGLKMYSVSRPHPPFGHPLPEGEGTSTDKTPITHHPSLITNSVTQGLNTLGIMLPYTPLHYLLLEQLQTPAIVLTSGNISDEPIVIDNEVAIARLGPLADAVITYNRDIYNRNDDSVVAVINGQERVLRRSRGYAPAPTELRFNAEGIVATGAELKNCFCLGKGRQAILSQHIGDLKNLETLEFYKEALDRYCRLFRVNKQECLLVHDLHPDYLSTRYAKESRLPTLAVQHHHAHIASCLAEYGLDEKVIGVSFDGTGFGDDGTIWGGEFFVCDLAEYKRVAWFQPTPMPGGEKAIEQPWRMAISYLYQAYGRDILNFAPGIIPAFEKMTVPQRELLLTSIDKQINAPLTSSAGRLFDAVSSLLGLCDVPKFEAEAAMRLEARAAGGVEEAYLYKEFNSNPSVASRHLPLSGERIASISVVPMIQAIVSDLKSGVDKSTISAKFHNTIVKITVDISEQLRQTERLSKVALSGGLFQNRYILTKTENLLRQAGFVVYSHTKVPTNDGGIALGQLAIAAKRRAK